MEPLELSYTATAEDYARSIRAVTLRRPAALFLIISFGLLFVMVVCTFLGVIMLILIGERPATDFIGFIYFLPCTTVLLLFPILLLLINPYLAGQRFNKHQDKVGQITWAMDDDKVRIDSALTKSETGWDIFSKAMENKRYYFLVYAMNKRMFQFIPKRAFESPQQEADFRRCVEKALGSIR
jgi:hypothetical protein